MSKEKGVQNVRQSTTKRKANMEVSKGMYAWIAIDIIQTTR